MFEEHSTLELGTTANGARPFLTADDRRRHIYVIGKTGTGKTSLLANLMLDDLAAGRGFALLDPHGDLARSIVSATPAWRIQDVLYLDPADFDYPFGFNPIANIPEAKRPVVAAHIVTAFAHIWGTTLETAPRMTYILMNSLRLLLDTPGATLLGLPRLLVDDGYRRTLLVHCRDPMIRQFWQDEFGAFNHRYALEAVAPVQNKVGLLMSDPVIRNILGQTRSTVDLHRLMDRRKVLLINLASGLLGETTTHLLGALFTTAFLQAATARADVPETDRIDFTLYADEFQHFATESFATILSEARKYRLALVLAHQFLGQLPDKLRQAVIGNSGTTMAFRVGAEDAPLLGRELGINSAAALTELASFTALIKLLQNGLPTEAHLITTDPPQFPEHNHLDYVIRRTRTRNTRPRQLVEERLGRFFSA